MKFSIALTVLVLAAGLGLCWRNQQQIALLREKHALAAAEAATLGITAEPGDSGERMLITRRSVREDKQAVAKRFAADMIGFAREYDAFVKAGGTGDGAASRRFDEFFESMASMNASQLKTVLTEIHSTTDISDKIREELMSSCSMSMATDYPQAALALFTGSTEFSDNNFLDRSAVGMALKSWASYDPIGAMEWVRKNSAEHPDLITDNARRSVISAAATDDPGLAFQMLDKLKPKDARQAVSQIMQAAQTPEERTAALGELRGYVAGIEDQAERKRIMDSAVSSLASSAVRDGFQSATRWVSEAGFSAGEIEEFAGKLSYRVKPAETGQWIDWVGEKLPPDKADGPIRNMVRNWAEKDYRAAGTWLANAPDGPEKQAAVRSYAETVAPYDPHAAAQWALTLPADEKLTRTLKQIHEQWPKDDAAGAAAFAQEHGLKP